MHNNNKNDQAMPCERIVYGDVTTVENASSQMVTMPIRALYDEFKRLNPTSKPKVVLEMHMRMTIVEND